MKQRALLVFSAALALGFAASLSYESAALGFLVTSGVAAAGLPFVTGRGFGCLGVDPAGTKTDGSIVFGSQIVTINTVAFIVEQGKVSRPSSKLGQMNQYGIEFKKVHKKGTASGSLTLQLPNDTTAAPALFAIVPLIPIGGGAAVNYYITEVGDEFSADGVTKVTCNIEEKLS